MLVRVAFYSPFVRLSRAKDSGDYTQARQIVRALESQGHTVKVISEYRARDFWRSARLNVFCSSRRTKKPWTRSCASAEE